jgi:hypothetical protein
MAARKIFDTGHEFSLRYGNGEINIPWGKISGISIIVFSIVLIVNKPGFSI